MYYYYVSLLLCAHSAENIWRMPQPPRTEPAPDAVLQHMTTAVTNMASADNMWRMSQAPRTEPTPDAVLQHMTTAVTNMASAVTSFAEMLPVCARLMAPHTDTASYPSAASVPASQYSDGSHLLQQGASGASVSGDIGNALNYLSL